MLELPEAYTLARQMNETIQGKTIKTVHANASPHGFAFFQGDPERYGDLLRGRTVGESFAFGGRVEITAGDSCMQFDDGINVRYIPPDGKLPEKHQLLIGFDDGSSMYCTVQMYGGLLAYAAGTLDNPYYLVAKERPSPLMDAFDEACFDGIVKNTKPTASAKALLATEQRIPGLGNGCLQDILFRAHVHPKRKINSLSDAELAALFASVKETLTEMCAKGGRNTEKDLYGNSGGYQTALSSKTWKQPCQVCGGEIIRAAYMGGNVYFCPACQPL